MGNRTLDEDGRETTQAFVIPRREGGVTVSLPVGQVHRLISGGLRPSQLAGPTRSADTAAILAQAGERLSELETWQSWEGGRSFACRRSRQPAATG